MLYLKAIIDNLFFELNVKDYMEYLILVRKMIKYDHFGFVRCIERTICNEITIIISAKIFSYMVNVSITLLVIFLSTLISIINRKNIISKPMTLLFDSYSFYTNVHLKIINIVYKLDCLQKH